MTSESEGLDANTCLLSRLTAIAYHLPQITQCCIKVSNCKGPVSPLSQHELFASRIMQDGSPSTWSADELADIVAIWRSVAEDFAPFDVDITTEDPGAAAMAVNSTRVAIGGSYNDCKLPQLIFLPCRHLGCRVCDRACIAKTKQGILQQAIAAIKLSHCATACKRCHRWGPPRPWCATHHTGAASSVTLRSATRSA